MSHGAAQFRGGCASPATTEPLRASNYTAKRVIRRKSAEKTRRSSIVTLVKPRKSRNSIRKRSRRDTMTVVSFGGSHSHSL